MVQKIIHFIKYHNAFTIIFGVVFLGFGVSYAASPAVRDSVFSSKETVVSIDNSAIVSAGLDDFDFNLRINSVTEDDTNYYAAYSYQTLLLEDGVWQNKVIDKIFKVSKEALDGKDLGLYVAEEVGEDIDYERSYLKRVQKLEKEKGGSRKIVAVEYSGLIGRLLNPEEKVIEGYRPVITPTPPAPSPLISDIAVEVPTGVVTPIPTLPIPSPTPIITATPSPAASSSYSPTPTPVVEVGNASTASESSDFPEGEQAPNGAGTTGQSPTPEPTPTLTPEISPLPIPTPDVTVSPTPTPSESPTPTPTPIPTPTPTPSETPTPEITPTPEPTP